MSSAPVSVVLALGLSSYQKTLLPHLQSEGMLRRAFVLGASVEIQEPAPGNSLQTIKTFPLMKISNRLMIAVWRRLPEKIQPGHPVSVAAPMRDRLVARWMVPSDIFHASAGLCLASAHAAKRRGAITIVEHAARHPRYWNESAVQEWQHFGLDGTAAPVFSKSMLRRMDREFAYCDYILVPSGVARESFAELGYGEKSRRRPDRRERKNGRGFARRIVAPICKQPVAFPCAICRTRRNGEGTWLLITSMEEA